MSRIAGGSWLGTTYPLDIARNADMALKLTVTSGGAAVNLSSATIAAIVIASDGTTAATFGATVSGAGSNIVTLALTDTQTAALTADRYRWQMVVTRGGDKRPWLNGPVTMGDLDDGTPPLDRDAVSLTVDTEVSVSIDVLAIGGTGGGAESLDDLTDVTITTPVLGNALVYNGSVWANAVPAGGGDMLKSENLSGLANTTTARSNLGLGSAATQASTAFDPAGSAAAAQAASQPVDADLTTIAAANNGTVLAATTASFLIADESKLDGIEAGADVTDTTNVTAAGALMDSEVDADLKTFALPANTTISTFGASLVDDADQATAQATLGLTPGTNVQPFDADLTDIAAISDVQGDIIVRGATGWERLAKSATATHVLTAGATQPDWAAPAASATNLSWTAATSVVASDTGTDATLTVADATNPGLMSAAHYTKLNTIDADITTFSLPASTTISAFGATLVDDADQATARTTLGLGTGATATIADYVAKASFPGSVTVALSDMTTQITATGNPKAYWVNPFDTALTITKVKATLATAGSGSTVVDINEGASILSTKITIDANETDSDDATNAPVISDTSIAADGRLTFDIDTAGTSAAGLQVTILFTRAV